MAFHDEYQQKEQPGPYPPQQSPSQGYPPPQSHPSSPGEPPYAPSPQKPQPTPGESCTAVLVLSHNSPKRIEVPVALRQRNCCVTLPTAESNYPMTLRGFVTKQEHCKVIDEVNQVFEQYLTCPQRIRQVLFLFITIFITCIIAGTVYLEFDYLVPILACVILFGVIAIIGFLLQSKIEQAWVDLTKEIAEISEKTFGSRGVAYHLEREETTLVAGSRSATALSMRIVIEIAADAEMVA